VNRQNILLEPDPVKFQIYETIHARWQAGATVRMEEDRSGVPAIRIDCEEISILTDILSLERWWFLRKAEEEVQNESLSSRGADETERHKMALRKTSGLVN